MLSERTTIALNHRNHHVIVTQEVDGTAQYVIFKGEIINACELDRIISVGNTNKPAKELLKEQDLKQLINLVIKKRGA